MSEVGVLEGISWVRLTFIDVFGTNNSVQIPVARYRDALERGVPFDGSALEGPARYLESDMLLKPDATTLVRLDDDLARVVCNVHSPDGARWPADPRLALEAVLQDAGDLSDLKVGAELEFYLLDADAEPIDTAGYFDEAEGEGSDVLRIIAERLARCGVPVEASHHEAGFGQYELDLDPLDALRLADGLVLTKHVARETARDHGMRATFMARPFA
jgi:glutamine synthetase